MDALVHRSCPVCGVDAYRPLCIRPDRLAVGQCACGMVYLPDVPDATQLDAFYAAYTSIKLGIPTRTRGWSRFSPFPPPHPHIEILKRTGGLRGRRVLEFGCFHGNFLRRALAEGASVFGIEIDETALTVLARDGIPAARVLEPGRRFDVVCAFQFIEHLADPHGWLEVAAQTLEPNGRLLLALPNGGEIAIAGPAWIGLRVDLEHLNYFDLRSLAALLEQSGFYVEQFWSSSQPQLAWDAAPRGPIRWIADAITRATSHPVFDHGTFALTVLARRA
jgi:SAM-dependent methyltransferase